MVHASFSLTDTVTGLLSGGTGELKPLSFPLGDKERHADEDGAGEGCMFRITDHNNGSLLCVSYPRSGERRKIRC